MLDTSISLLDRLSQQPEPDPEAWNRLVELYTPVLRAWLRRYESLATADADDLIQEVLLTLVRELPQFQHGGRPGAFRGWLRITLVHRLRHFWRSRQNRPATVGGSDFLDLIEQLGDDESAASRVWDQEHDRQLVSRLLAMAEPRFAPPTWLAFRRQVIDGIPAESVAKELTMPLHSVYAAKSRVLHALRTLGDGLVS